MNWGVDPGCKKSAVAIGNPAGQLCGISWIPAWSKGQLIGEILHTLTIEKPRIYPGMPNVDANDLLDLAEVVGWLRYALPAVKQTAVYPQDWKGQISKPIHHDRIWTNMLPEERALFPVGTYEKIQQGLDGKPYKSEVHNLLDAVGLLFFGVGRLGRGGTRIR